MISLENYWSESRYLTQKTNALGNTVLRVCSRLKHRTLVVRRGKSRCGDTPSLTSAVGGTSSCLTVLVPVSLSLLRFSSSLPTPGGHAGLPITSFHCFLITFPAPLLLVFSHPLRIPVISSVRFEHFENIFSCSIMCP